MRRGQEVLQGLQFVGKVFSTCWSFGREMGQPTWVLDIIHQRDLVEWANLPWIRSGRSR